MKKIGSYRYYRNALEIEEFHSVFVNGYVLGKHAEDTKAYKPIFVSLIGHKNRIVGASKTPKHLRLSYEDSGLLGYLESGMFCLGKDVSHGHLGPHKEWLACGRFDQEKEEFSQPIRSQDGSVYVQNYVFRDKFCNPENVGLENAGSCFILGKDRDEVMQKIPVYLGRITAPHPPEWTEAIWQRICLTPTVDLNIEELIGYNMAGVKLTYDAEALRNLISEMYLAGEFNHIAAA